MRGVSPVVATILMVAIAIAAAVVAYSWLSSLQQSAQAAGSRSAQSVGTVPVTVLGVKCNDANDVNVILYNPSPRDYTATASVRIKIGTDVDKVLNGVSITVPAGATAQVTLDTDLAVGGTACTARSGQSVDLEIYTPEGTIKYVGKLP